MAARSCPKCGSTKIEGDECLHCGIYISKYLAYLARGGPAQVAPTASAVGHMAAVPFKVYGAEMQFVELELATGVAAVAEAGEHDVHGRRDRDDDRGRRRRAGGRRRRRAERG